MNEALNNLIIYRASAGSGKTYTLTLEYLTLLLRGIDEENRVKYDGILVVTFTNKATVELRIRILQKLYELSQGRSDIEDALLKKLWGDNALSTPSKRDTLRQYARRALREILEDYSYFRVQTIDSFFQEVIRSFVLEIDRLHGGFEVELNHAEVVALSLEEMLRELSIKGDELLDESLETIYSMEEERDHRLRLRSELSSLMSQFMRDPRNGLVVEEAKDAKAYLTSVQKAIQNLSIIKEATSSGFVTASHNLRNTLIWIRDEIGFDLKESYSKVLFNLLSKLEADDDSLLKEWLKGGLIGKTLMTLYEKTENDPSAWVASNKKSAYAHLTAQFSNRLREDLNSLITNTQDDKAKLHYCSAKLLLEKLHWLPILTHFKRKVDEFQRNNGIILISEMNDLLRDIIGETDTPFIYDKIGNRIEHFLIDEFQDTNATQWHNLLPLLAESLAHNRENFIVGDVKQSIYRFRGGDSELLGVVLPEAKSYSTQPFITLEHNYRSREVIVDFNNGFFTDLYNFKDFIRLDGSNDSTKKEKYPISVLEAGENIAHKAIYNRQSVYQKLPAGDNKRGGFVSVKVEVFTKDELKTLIDKLYADGYRPGEIAILTRRNTEATMIAEMLNELSAEAETTEGNKYRFISNNALRIANSPTVQLLTAYIHQMAHPGIKSARDLYEITLYNYLPSDVPEDVPDRSSYLGKILSDIDALSPSGISLYEVVSTLLNYLGTLKETPTEEMVYINAFLDKLFDFIGRYPATFGQFDEWWQAKKGSLYIEMSTTHINAIQIHTIHKVKGLEFPTVIIPYASWNVAPPMQSTNVKLYDISQEVSTELIQEPQNFSVNGIYAPPYPTQPRYQFFSSNASPSTAQSIFIDPIAKELEASYMDTLNLLYVAFTRPSERLYVYTGSSSEKKEDEGKLKLSEDSSRIIQAGIASLTGGIDLATEGIWTMGKEEPRSLTKPEKGDEHLTELTANPQYDDLTMRQPRYHNPAIDRGEVLHDLMSRVQIAEDFYRLTKGKEDVWNNEIDAFKKATSDPLSPEHFFFDPPIGWSIQTEHSMYSSKAKRRLRTDRLLINREKGMAMVLDYKFGTPSPAHHRQVKRYLETLQDMGLKARGFLWYNFRIIEEVK